MFSFAHEDAQTKASDIDSNSDHFKTKKYFQENKLSGLYQQFDPFTDQLREEGNFKNGIETGKWRVIDEDGDQVHYMYQMIRVGARCRDGTFSQATGGGACSWHGGVSEWLMGSQKTKIGGTGKYVPIDQRVVVLRNKVKLEFGFNKTGLQLEQQILKMALKEKEEIRVLKKQLEEVKLQLEEQIKKKIQLEISMQSQLEQKSVSEDLKISKDITEDKKTQPKFSHKHQFVNGQSQVQSLDISLIPTNQQKSTVRKQELKKSEEEQKRQRLKHAFENYKCQQYEGDGSESDSDDEQRSQNQSALIRELMQKLNISNSK